MSLCGGFAPNRVAGTSSILISMFFLLTCIGIRQETFSIFLDGVLDRLSQLSVFNSLRLVRTQIWQVDLILLNFNWRTHVWSEPFAEFSEVDVAVLVQIEDLLHHSLDLLLSRINLNLFQMSLEVLVTYKSVTINVEGFKKAVGWWFCGIRSDLNFE